MEDKENSLELMLPINSDARKDIKSCGAMLNSIRSIPTPRVNS